MVLILLREYQMLGIMSPRVAIPVRE